MNVLVVTEREGGLQALSTGDRSTGIERLQGRKKILETRREKAMVGDWRLSKGDT
jgi:hypothetical protein